MKRNAIILISCDVGKAKNTMQVLQTIRATLTIEEVYDQHVNDSSHQKLLKNQSCSKNYLICVSGFTILFF